MCNCHKTKAALLLLVGVFILVVRKYYQSFDLWALLGVLLALKGVIILVKASSGKDIDWPCKCKEKAASSQVKAEKEEHKKKK